MNDKNSKEINSASNDAVLYSVDQQKLDEASLNYSLNNNKPIDLEAFRRVFMRDIITNTNILESGFVGKVSMRDLEFAFDHPSKAWRTLLRLSNELMHISPIYYRFNMFFSNMACFCWWVDLYGVSDKAKPKQMKQTYTRLAEKLEKMNLKHEFTKIMKILPYQDIYCGVVVEGDSSYFIQQIDYKVCRLYEVEDGLYNFIIDLAAIKAHKLNAYPVFIQEAYKDFVEGNISNWYKPDSDLQICLKLNTQWTYPYPLLVGLVRDLFDLDTYKKLKLQSARTDNYKAIMVKVPIDEDSVDKPLLSLPLLQLFAELNRASLSDDIGLLYTLGATGEAINFKDSTNTTNNVADATDNLFELSGINQNMFNGSNATSLNISIENNASFIYGVYRQIERWVNRWIQARGYNKSSYKFAFYLLDVNIYNKDTVTKRYKDAITLGVTCIDRYLSSLDLTPSRVLGSYVTHQEIFKFNENFIPLSTSYNSSDSSSSNSSSNSGTTTTTSDENTGRPQLEDNELTDEGDRAREEETNIR